MSRELIRQLKALKHTEVNPREEWLQKNREVLLSQIKNTVAPENHSFRIEDFWNSLSIFVPKTMVYNVLRPVAVLLVVAMVASSGWVATVDAAYNALPGDWLYPAKRAMEKTQLTVASVVGGKDAETKLHAQLAKTRAVEAKQIVKSNAPDKDAKVKQVVGDLKQEMNSVSANLDAMKNSGSSAQVVQDVKQQTDQVKSVLYDVKTNLLASADTSTLNAVSEAKDLAKDTTVKAMEVIVTKHLDGDKTVSPEDIKKELSNTLNAATTEADTAKQNVDAAKVVVDAVKTEMKEAARENSNIANATSTRELTDKVTSVAQTADQAVTKTDEVKATADKKVDEAKDLLSKGDLANAMNAVKQVSDASKETEKISDQTLTQVQTVLPVVTVVKEVVPVMPEVKSPEIKVEVTTTPSTTAPAPVVNVIVTTSSTSNTVTKPVTSTVKK